MTTSLNRIPPRPVDLDQQLVLNHVTVFEEFADLILAGKKEKAVFENLVARLAAKGRAAGIHLMLATQRPAVRPWWAEAICSATAAKASNAPSRLSSSRWICAA